MVIKKLIIIIKEDIIYHQGDERSKTHPGHGYPEYTENVSKAAPNFLPLRKILLREAIPSPYLR